MPRVKKFTVVRAQDGAEVRADLPLKQAKVERDNLNAQARQVTSQTVDGIPIYGSMIHGSVSRYEVRSADGLVIE